MKKKIIIGSRGSDLALWQANHIKDRLEELGAEVIIKIFKTQGDKIQHLSLEKLEGKGFFTKELEDALLQNEIDLAVHSHKDLPTVSPEGLMISAVSEREDPSELILINKESVDITKDLFFKENAIVGTSSSRRKSQLFSFRPDIQIKDIRGNVPTRIQKLREGQYDAIMLAQAGVERLKLDLNDLYIFKVDPLKIIPAPAQGVLALQIRNNDTELHDFLQTINNKEVSDQIYIERKILNLFEGGCHMPLGAYAIYEDGKYKVWVAKSDHAEDIPVRLYLESNERNGLAEQALSVLKSDLLKGKKVFITRDISDQSILAKTLQTQGAELFGNSYIKTEFIPFNLNDIDKYEIIFFNSPKAVKYFFENQNALPVHLKFAAYGQGTERILNEFGYVSSFTGKNSDPQIVAAAFNEKYHSLKKILFPHAENSLHSVSSILATKHEVSGKVIYRTTEVANSLPESDVYIFTSPSNVRACAKSLHGIKTSKIVACGPSTAEELSLMSISVDVIADRSDELGLAEAVLSCYI